MTMNSGKHVKIKITGIILFLMIAVFLLISKKKSPSPDIFLITIDAARADHFGCYGYQRNTSPNIDRLAREAVVFLNCFTTSCATTYSTVGLLTGRYLGISEERKEFWDNVLDSKFITLATYLRKFGYETKAFLGNPILRKDSGFEQGFTYYRLYSDERQMTDRLLTLLKEQTRKKPLFVWVHYMGPHTPYHCHQEYMKEFEGDRLYKENDKILRLNPDNKKGKNYMWFCTSGGYIPLTAFQKDKYNLNYYIACYDAGMRNADSYIGELLGNIKDNSVIVLSADHGESLGERNVYFEHGGNIYDELLRVPLIIKDNRYFKGDRKVSMAVSSVDIVPTILNIVNPLWYSLNRKEFNGVDLGAIIKNNVLHRKYIYSYYPLSWCIRGVNRNFKYILQKDRKEELYIVPDEYNNLINDDSAKTAYIKEELRQNLRIWRDTYPEHSDINAKRGIFDEYKKEALKSLGYLQ